MYNVDFLIEHPYYIHRKTLVTIGKTGEYHKSITKTISMMVLVNWIIVRWSIRSLNKIKIMGTSLYEVTKGNTMESDMDRRLMGCFCVTQNGDLR